VVPPEILGLPPIVVFYILMKCGYEVEQPDDLSEEERNRLYLKCIFSRSNFGLIAALILSKSAN